MYSSWAFDLQARVDEDKEEEDEAEMQNTNPLSEYSEAAS